MIKKIFLFSALGILVLWTLGLIIFGYSINHFTTDQSTHTDAIVVLTGGRNRIPEAVRLLNLKLSNHLFISGVDKDTSLRNIIHTQKLFPHPDSVIEIGHNATDTIGNAEETLNWSKTHNISSLRLVTSNYHLSRALIEFKHFMPQTTIVAHPAFSDHIEKKWWTSWQTFSLICKEYNKLIYAFIKYKLTL